MTKKLLVFLSLLTIALFIGGCAKKSDIVGLWLTTDNATSEMLLEFTSTGQFFHQDGSGEYEVVDDGTIEITVPEGKETMSNVVITDTTLTFQTGTGNRATFNRAKEYPNLKNDIVGIWTSRIDGDVLTVEFDDGKIVFNDIPFGNYTLLSDNTILITLEDGFSGCIFVTDLSNDKLKVIFRLVSFEELLFVREE